MHATDQLQEAKRLGDVIVSTLAKPANLVPLLGSRCEDENRDFVTLIAQCRQNLVAVHARQHQIENYQPWLKILRRLQALDSICGDRGRKSFDLKIVREAAREI